MLNKICYLGDDSLAGAAAYLAGVMTHFGMPFDYVPSSEPPGGRLVSDLYRLYVLSDYPAARFAPGAISRACPLPVWRHLPTRPMSSRHTTGGSAPCWRW